MMKFFKALLTVSMFFASFSWWQSGNAQGLANQEAFETQAVSSEAKLTTGKNKKSALSFTPDTFPSLLFTYWEQVAIDDARNSRGLTRAPSDNELFQDLNSSPDEFREKPPPEERDISLSGILYNHSKDWIVWLNGKRVTPGALPSEVLDLKVYKEYIELKWFDDYSNNIYPIRLRPHQRFNIDTRIFLPG